MAPSLTQAIRRARLEDAERTDVLAELRGAEIARLEMLQDALAPVLAQVPAHADLFDTGLTLGDKPRLFIDMLAFVELGRDRKTYRLQQDTRHGRVTLGESERMDTMLEAVAAYMGRRLVEREKALAADGAPPILTALDVPGQSILARRFARLVSAGRPGLFRMTLGLLIDILGTLALLGLVAAGAWFVLRGLR